MNRRATVAVLALLSFCFPIAATQADEGSGPVSSLYGSNSFNAADGSLLLRSIPIALSDGRYLATSSPLARMGAVSLDLLPLFYFEPAQTQRGNASVRYQTNLPGRYHELAGSDVYVGGEMGVLYGRSSGKYGGSEFESYIFGSVGNEHLQITAGAAYDESTFRFPRRAR